MQVDVMLNPEARRYQALVVLNFNHSGAFLLILGTKHRLTINNFSRGEASGFKIAVKNRDSVRTCYDLVMILDSVLRDFIS